MSGADIVLHITNESRFGGHQTMLLHERGNVVLLVVNS